ncbi:MAG TPA: lipid-binding SYLF domain-containing protein [Geobacteraceae bacterium]|nr:lipid-binding SYLF domain-containing protein [Geobacteraceae bacterium]
MKNYCKLMVITLMLVMAAPPLTARAASRAEIDRDATFALQKLYDGTPLARMLADKARGILIFPSIVKGGLIIGGQYGDGALRVGGATTGYYRSVALSYGLQAGVQAFGYALFFMNDKALNYLKKSKGWEIGVGPSIVIVDKGAAKALTTTTAKDDIYAFFFDQKGLMAGLGLQGTKITRIHPK